MLSSVLSSTTSSLTLSSLLLAQAVPIATASDFVVPQEVRALPGSLDQLPVLNSNSPEIIKSPGILISTFPGAGKRFSRAHLNYALSGQFDILAHHVTRINSKRGNRSLYHGILLHNPGSAPARVRVIQASSYLSSAHAPFVRLADHIFDPYGRVFSGPGSRIASDILRGRGQRGWPRGFVIPPRQSYMVLNRPIPPSNSRTTWIRLQTNGKLYAASMAQHGSPRYTAPTLIQWKRLLFKGGLIYPRDKAPSPLSFRGRRFIYGRVAGISRGAEWRGKVTDQQNSAVLNVPNPGEAISYVINSLHRGTFGTGQIQSAPMLVRYADTAYLAHGNYGIKYNLDFPLHNATRRTQNVTLALQTPLKEDRLSKRGLRFLRSPTGPAFFRGTVKLSFPNSLGTARPQYFHLVQRRGQRGKPLVTLPIPPRETKLVKVELLYPPDSTPPQVLTINTL